MPVRSLLDVRLADGSEPPTGASRYLLARFAPFVAISLLQGRRALLIGLTAHQKKAATADELDAALAPLLERALIEKHEAYAPKFIEPPFEGMEAVHVPIPDEPEIGEPYYTPSVAGLKAASLCAGLINPIGLVPGWLLGEDRLRDQIVLAVRRSGSVELLEILCCCSPADAVRAALQEAETAGLIELHGKTYRLTVEGEARHSDLAHETRSIAASLTLPALTRSASPPSQHDSESHDRGAQRSIVWDHQVWWLRKGDNAALIEGEPLTFEWDDGLSWGFRFRGCSVLWDYDADASIQGLEESTFEEKTRQQIRDAIRALAGPGFHPIDFTDDEKAVMKVAVDRLRAGDGWTSGRQLRSDLGDWDRPRLERTMSRLEPRYFARTRGSSEYFRPRLATLFKSDEKAAVEQIILAAIGVLRSQYDRSADVTGYSLGQVLLAAGLDTDHLTFVDNVLVIAGLAFPHPVPMNHALGSRRSPDADDVETFRKSANMLDYARATSANPESLRPWPTAPLDMLRGELSALQKTTKSKLVPAADNAVASETDLVFERATTTNSRRPEPVGAQAIAAAASGTEPTGAAPERTVDFVIITALTEERDAVLAHLPGNRKLPKDAADIHTYYEADLQTRRPDGASYRVVVTCLANMGPLRAAAKTAAVIQRWKPRHVLLVGIAGGVGGDVELGDVLIAEQIADYTLGKVEPAPGFIGFVRNLVGGSGKRTVRWQTFRTDANLFDSARNLGNEWQELIKATRPGSGLPVQREGVIASGGDVIAYEELMRDYKRGWGKLIGVEMEAGGTASMLHEQQNGPRFFMIRSASDFANPAKNAPDTKKWRAYAYDVAAAYTFALLTEGPVAAHGHVASNTAQTTSSPAVETRTRDLRALRDFWLNLPTDEADYYFERAGYRIIPHSIFHHCEGIEALTASSGFHIYDAETRHAVAAFVTPFLRSLARLEFFRELASGKESKFMGSHDHANYSAWEAELNVFQTSVANAEVAYKGLVALMRQKWPEIDLEETSQRAREHRRRSG